MEEELRQIMFKYRRDEISVDGALLRIETLINAPKNTIHNSKYKQCEDDNEESILNDDQWVDDPELGCQG